MEKEMDLVNLCRYIWSKRWFLCKIICVGFIIGIVVALSIPKEYSSKVKLFPYVSKEEKIEKNASLASMLGLNVNNSSFDNISLDFYPVAVKSTPFLVDLAGMKVRPINLSEMTLFEYITENQKKTWWRNALDLPRKLFSTASSEVKNQNLSWDPFNLTQQQEAYLETMNNTIVVWTDKKSGLLNIDVYMQDAVIAALIADTTISKLQSYIQNIQKTKLLDDASYSQKMYEEAKKTYNVAQHENGRLGGRQIEMEVSLSLCNMIARQYEMLQARILEDRALFSVIEPAKVALKAEKPNRRIIVFVFTFLFGFIGVVWVVLKRIFQKE